MLLSMPVDRRAAAEAIAGFLRALGHDPAHDPELAETPDRVVAAFADELLTGYAVDLGELVSSFSSERSPSERAEVVVVRDVSVATVCPHHLMPALGTATVAYLPGPRWLGLGVLARLAQACARRLALQEAIGQNVVRALEEHAGALGAYCELTLVHGCLSARGAGREHARVTTVALSGVFCTAEGRSLLSLALGQPSAPAQASP
jgi:GTP cyclohydrolase I